MDFSTGRPVDYLSRSEYEQVRSDGKFTPGGLTSTIIVPAIAEIYSDLRLNGVTMPARLGGKNLGVLKDNTGKGRAATKAEIRSASAGKSIATTSGAPINEHRAYVTDTQSRKVSGLVNMRTIARSIGMVELMKVGVDLGAAAVDSVMNYRSAPKEISLTTGPGFFNDTRAAQTQRQRAIQAIHNSQLTTRAALGNEASFLHI